MTKEANALQIVASDSYFHVTLYHSSGRKYVSMHHILEFLVSKVREKAKIKESIQSRTTPDPGHHIRK